MPGFTYVYFSLYMYSFSKLFCLFPYQQLRIEHGQHFEYIKSMFTDLQ